ncbi:MAG TPA: hypothetical protein VK702_11435 [Candidatus Acidoferrum sp.]|jgi:hypothetical protein|nr:hypothetical protein [Candidatus Acidoferrum sp.]
MHRTAKVAIASLVLAAFALLTPMVASADQRFTLEIAPVFFQDNTGDSSVPPLGPNYTPLYCTAGQPTCPNGNPQTTSNLRLDYGLTYQINKRFSLNYSHSNFDFSLGRISSIPTGLPAGFPQNFSVLTGSIDDRIDTGTLNYAAGHGLTFDAYYTSHQRIVVTALNAYGPCMLNSEECVGGTSNPSSINAVFWGVGGAYTFGPHTAYEPPMFKATFDINYYPRPANGNCGTALAQPACNSNGINGYVGSGAVYPWSLTMFPFSAVHLLQPGTIPFIGYSDSPIWFHAENSPEAFNNVVAGIVQVLPHGLSLSYTYLKLNGRLSSDTVPPPDSIRSATSLLKLTYDLHF